MAWPALGQTKDAKQTPPPSTTPTSPAADPTTDTLTLDSVTAQIKQLEADSETEDSLKTKLLTAYRLAESQLKAAASHQKRAAALKLQIENAPEQTGQFTKALEALPVLVEDKAAEALDIKPDELDKALAKAQSDLAALKSSRTALETEVKDLTARPTKAREELAAAKAALEQVEKDLKVAPPADEPPKLTAARRASLEARQRARTAEIAALDQELVGHDARLTLKTAELDLVTRQAANAEVHLKVVQNEVNRIKREEAEKARRAAEQAQREAIGKHPAIKQVADENAKLSTDLANIVEQDQQANDVMSRLGERLDQLTTQFKDAKERIEKTGLNETLGRILRDQRNSLPNINRFERDSNERSKRLAVVSNEKIDLDQRRRKLSDVQSAVADRMTSIESSLDPDQRDEIEAELQKLLASQKELLDKLGPEYADYINTLGALDFKQRQLIDRADEFAEFLDKRLLWIPSAQPVNSQTLDQFVGGLKALVSPNNWSALITSLRTRVFGQLVPTIVVVLLFIVMLVARRPLRKRSDAMAEHVGKAKQDNFRWTLFVLGVALLAALPWPLLVGTLGWLLRDDFTAGGFVRGFGAGLVVAAWLLFPILALAGCCRKSGLMRVHLRWTDRSTTVIRRNLLWLRFVAPVFAFFITFADWQADDASAAGLGRVAFMLAMIVFAVFIARMLNVKSGAVAPTIQRHPGTLLARTRYAWYVISVGTPVVLAMLAAVGYYFTAQQLEHRLLLSVYIILLAIVIDDLVIRWLMLARVKLALKQAEEKRAALKAAKEAEAESEEEIAASAEPSNIDLAAVNEQTRQFVRGLIGVSLFLALWGVWASVLPALGILDEIELWHQSTTVAGEVAVVPITLKSLGLAILGAGLTIVAARNLPGALDMIILGRLPMDSGTRYAVSTISRYVIVGVGVVLAFNMIGIGWAQVQWLLAALTVGLGFGLQEIFANFVSGIIILVERPIRVGDTVTVGETSGIVTRIRIRATTITDWNRKELIVPNKRFITEDVINWTLSDPVTRLDIMVGIAYGSNTELALQTMTETVKTLPGVIDSPEPEVFFLGFGDNTLNFEVRVFVRETTNKGRTKVVHAVHMAIDQAFREKDIVIAFPQRDLHIKSSEVPINIIAQMQSEAARKSSQNTGQHPAGA